LRIPVCQRTGCQNDGRNAISPKGKVIQQEKRIEHEQVRRDSVHDLVCQTHYGTRSIHRILGVGPPAFEPREASRLGREVSRVRGSAGQIPTKNIQRDFKAVAVALYASSSHRVANVNNGVAALLELIS
jgi:hypothetical protein